MGKTNVLKHGRCMCACTVIDRAYAARLAELLKGSSITLGAGFAPGFATAGCEECEETEQCAESMRVCRVEAGVAQTKPTSDAHGDAPPPHIVERYGGESVLWRGEGEDEAR